MTSYLSRPQLPVCEQELFLHFAFNFGKTGLKSLTFEYTLCIVHDRLGLAREFNTVMLQAPEYRGNAGINQ